jgi:UDP-2,3-diacylglucosamine pyrophosphatase LpxH
VSYFSVRHTAVLSDIHLSEAEPGEGLWMRYRQRAFSPQGEIAAMLDVLRAQVGSEELTLVFNGDVFDLDAPRVINNQTVFHDYPRTVEHALPAVAGILEDHPDFVAAIGRVLAAGHRVILVSGNHDVQLVLPEVRSLITERLTDAALAAGALAGEGTDPSPEQGAARAAIAARVVFRTWFHKSDDGIVIEHGNQYDPYCSYRYPMAPFGRREREIQPTMGSLVTRHLASRMGYFNPHVDSSFMLSIFGYLAHWARFYLFSRRSIAVTWIVGTARTLLELWRRRDPFRRSRWRESVAACARETGVSAKVVARHARLFAKPAEDRLLTVVKALRLDRAVALMLALLAAVAWMWFVPVAWPIGLAIGPLFVVGYEVAAPTMSLASHWKRVSRFAPKVRAVHGARAVVFGHTHNPEGGWDRGVFMGNTGSWSAAFRDLACTQPLYDERPLIWLRCDEQGELHGGLYGWKGGRFEPRVVRSDELAAAVQEPADGSRPARAEPGGYSLGTDRARMTPGIDAANAIAKNTVNPTSSAT